MISGRTRVLAHLGVPTEGFVAPLFLNPWLARAGADVAVVPMGAEPEDFSDLLRRLARLRNFAGALVTMPHKAAAAALLDEAGPAVRACGACNAVRAERGRLIGDMFDGAGFVRGMERRGRAAAGASALVVGAGGVGSAIAAALAGAGAARVTVSDVHAARSDALAARLSRAFPASRARAGPPDPEGHDVVVNATPLGMRPDDPPPLDPARLAPGAFVGEVVMAAHDTPLLAAARARGCPAQAGVDMLLEQLPACLEFFGLPTATPEQLRQTARFP